MLFPASLYLGKPKIFKKEKLCWKKYIFFSLRLTLDSITFLLPLSHVVNVLMRFQIEVSFPFKSLSLVNLVAWEAGDELVFWDLKSTAMCLLDTCIQTRLCLWLQWRVWMDGRKERRTEREANSFFLFLVEPHLSIQPGLLVGKWSYCLHDIKTVVSCGSGGRLVIHQTVG